MSRHSLGTILIGLLVLAAPTALAQTFDGLDAERFRPATDTQGLILTEGGQGEQGGDINLGFWLHYSDDALILKRNGEISERLLDERLAADLVISMGMTSWLSLGVDVPVAIYQTGLAPSTTSTGTSYSDITSTALGDIRVVPKFTLLREKKHGISLSLLAPVSLPSGDESAYMGSSGVTVAPTLALSRHLLGERLFLAANLGFWVREAVDVQNLKADHEFFYRLGLGVRLSKRLWALGEAAGAARLENLGKNRPEETSLEWLLGLRVLGPKDLWFTAGGAAGTLPGWGTPNFRAFLSMMWAPRVHDRDGDGLDDPKDRCPDQAGPAENQGCPWPDTDQDGVTDNLDRCPEQAGPSENQGCPWGDKDNDGLTDNVDKCPEQAGPKENQGCPWPDADKDGVPDKDDKCIGVPGPVENQGCPWGDKDNDGLTDNVDKCPEQAGPKENQGCPWGDKDNDGLTDDVDKCPEQAGPKENQGCPWPDADKDGIPDKDDKCPDQPGMPENKGCPKGKVLVIVKQEKIEILQKIHFATGKADIMRDSFGLLDQVYLVLKTHEEIKKVRIEGHTDSQGKPEFNLKLSQDRANSVRAYLIKRGLAPERLEAVGYGLTRPIAPNTTPKGREENRRVEFVIVSE
ncbi:MAG: OmpA family protein [Myxococcales bacterium]|nr:OmpA family protein [Myxococcales bacterium]